MILKSIILTIALITVSSVPAFADTLAYRCWSFNVDGAGGRCTSPSLVFHSNGQYELGSERGMYGIRNGKMILSESKFRGLGQLLENGYQIRFEYDYNGKHHTVIYALVPGAAR